MAKKVQKKNQTGFKFNFDSLLKPDSLDDNLTSSNSESWSQWHTIKTTNEKIKSTSTKFRSNSCVKNITDENYTSNFLRFVGNDFNKSLRTRKKHLNKFTKVVTSKFHMQLIDTLKKQQKEINTLKKLIITKTELIFARIDEEFQKLHQQEYVLSKMLQKQVSIIQNAHLVHQQLLKHFFDLQKNSLQVLEKIKAKQKYEATDLIKFITQDISEIEENIVMEFKNEEIENLRKYFSKIYF